MSTEQLLDDLAAMQTMDKRGMLRLVRELPEQCETALGIGRSLPVEPLPFTPNVILIAGASDCAVASDIIVETVCEDIAIPIISDHSGRIPGYVGEQSLVFVIDYTGKSDIALASYHEARLKGATVICVTCGGKLNEAAANDEVRVVKIPPGQPARSAVGYLFIPVVAILEKLGLISGQTEKLTYGIRLLKNVRETLRSEVPLARNVAKQAARALTGKLAVIFSAAGYRTVVALRFRSQIGSNVGATACVENISDAIPARMQFADTAYVLLKDNDDKGNAAAREALGELNISELKMKGTTNIEKLLYGIYLADYVSCYLAFLCGVDPTSGEPVTKQE
ncbi:MAG: SIS domain-containing protein [Armatimonadota bacterium]